MSGGAFGYDQEIIPYVVSKLKEVYESEEWDAMDPETDTVLLNSIVEDALEHLRKAYLYTRRLDWFFSGDDGFESMVSRIKEGLEYYEKHRRLGPEYEGDE